MKNLIQRYSRAISSVKTDYYSSLIKGEDYTKLRPKYPSHFLTDPLHDLKHKGKYLDVATGNGQVMFDSSRKSLELTSKSKLSEHSNVKLEVCDFMEWETQEKLDYITVG